MLVLLRNINRPQFHDETISSKTAKIETLIKNVDYLIQDIYIHRSLHLKKTRLPKLKLPHRMHGEWTDISIPRFPATLEITRPRFSK